MFSKSALVALTVALSATAVTASASNQFALSLGVEPGVYTTAELTRLADARERNDKTAENAVLRQAEASARGASFAQHNNDVVIEAYTKTFNDDNNNARDLTDFVAHMNGDYDVSPQTAAFARDVLENGGVAD